MNVKRILFGVKKPAKPPHKRLTEEENLTAHLKANTNADDTQIKTILEYYGRQ